MVFNGMICFIVFNKRNYDKLLCNFRSYKEIVSKATCTNLLIWCQQTTKTTLNCNADSFGPVCQLWSLTLKCMRDSKPQRSVQQHKSRKVTRNATNRHKHINEASNQILTNNLYKISCEYTQGMFFNAKICFNAFNIRTYDEYLYNLRNYKETVQRKICINFPIWC